jgi:hypothetical protein
VSQENHPRHKCLIHLLKAPIFHSEFYPLLHCDDALSFCNFGADVSVARLVQNRSVTMSRSISVVAALLLSVAAAAAQDAAKDSPAPPADAGTLPNGAIDNVGQRYRFTKTDDGVLRLDSQTGQVSLCSARSLGWACQLVPDDRTALDNEIGRLQSQVDALNKQVAELRDAPSPNAAPNDPPRPREGIPPSASGELKLPNRADLDRAKAFIDDAWRRLVDMLEQWRKDLRRT